MITTLLSFLARDWAGLVLAAIPTVAGAAAVLRARAGGSAAWLACGVVLLVLASLMAIGSVLHLVHTARMRARHPAPGRLVDVGGYRIHVLAEGDGRGAPSIVWMAGGHAAGYSLHHLHRMLRTEARSILIDRPGVGWSDVGPFPRTTAREAEEMWTALDAAGERGPFILVGHSFGGLLVANMARRRPERVATLVLLDATPPDTVIFGPRIPVLKMLRQQAVLRALPRLFGFHADLSERRLRRMKNADVQRVTSIVDRQLGDAARVLREVECGTAPACTGASIYSELSPAGLAEVAWSTVVYEGDLGDLPVLLVAPGAMEDAEFASVMQMIEADQGRGSVDPERLRRFYARSRERYLTISSNARRVVAPKGTGHNFPYEEPEFVAGVIRSVLAACAGSKPAGGVPS